MPFPSSSFTELVIVLFVTVTCRGVIPTIPCTEITSAEAVPEIPSAGCFADVDAPAGKGKAEALTACVAGKFETATDPIAFAPAGIEGRDKTATLPEIGCVTPEPSTSNRVDVTVRFDGTFVLKDASVASVEAPAGNALELTTTAPVFTAITLLSIDAKEAFPDACNAEVEAPLGNADAETATVPETGWVVAEPSTLKALIWLIEVSALTTTVVAIDPIEVTAAKVDAGFNKEFTEASKASPLVAPTFAVTVPTTGTAD